VPKHTSKSGSELLIVDNSDNARRVEGTKRMRGREDDVRDMIRILHGETISFCERLLANAHELHARLCNKEVRRSQEGAKAVVVGLWTKTCKQYRAVLVLSELGLVEDAETIARSLFETTIQILFVAKRNVRLTRGWKTAPMPPRGAFSMEFRAQIYLARTVLDDKKRLNVWQQTRGCKRPAKRMQAAVDEMVAWAESDIGTKWLQWLRDSAKSRTAFQVETMAHNVGLARWYATVYRTESTIVHAADATQHFDAGSEPMTVDVSLGPNIEGATTGLKLANALVETAMSVINARYYLGRAVEIG
jgi:hypothetical protein